MQSFEKLKEELSNLLVTGLNQREYISQHDKDVSIMVENQRTYPFYYNVLLIDNRSSVPDEDNITFIGRNLSELEALQLCFNFAKHNNLF